MTKVIILGQPTEQKQCKKIEFVKSLTTNFIMKDIEDLCPERWENIELICKNYNESSGYPLDLMFAYNKERTKGCLYVGYFNDGIV